MPLPRLWEVLSDPITEQKHTLSVDDYLICNTWLLLCRSQWSKSPWAMYSIMSRIGFVVVQHPKKLRTFWCFPTFFMSSISSINSLFSSSLAFSGDNKDRWVQERKNKSVITATTSSVKVKFCKDILTCWGKDITVRYCPWISWR